MLNKLFHYVFHEPSAFILKLCDLLMPVLTDKLYLKIKFRFIVGYWPNIENPRTYNEKLQWLKLHDKRQEYTKMVDKIEAKQYVSSKIGEKYIIPTIGIWETLDEIDWNQLPDRFVIKATHDSGGVVVCKDKSKLDIDKAKKVLAGAGKKDFTKFTKEYPYKNVKHRYIAEEYMEDESGFELKDYKIFCFDGKPGFLFVATGRQNHDTRFDFYDMEFNHLPVLNGHPNADKWPQKPENFEEIIEISKKLSKGIPHVRVDLYNINGKIYFGELTFFHWSGLKAFEPIEWDYKFGEYIQLPEE